MKKFDLKNALAGEPVKLRCGAKAYVKYILDEEYNTNYPLRGFLEWARIDGGIGVAEYSWTSNGRLDTYRETELDIVGMWEEPKPKRYVNGIEVPESVTLDTLEDGVRYWFVDFTYNTNVGNGTFYKDSATDKRLISQGIVFENREDAETMAKALLNYKEEYKQED